MIGQCGAGLDAGLDAGLNMGRMKRDHLAEEERRRRATVLGELWQERVDIFCWCNRCAHNSVLPVELFIAQLGPDFPVPDVGAHLRCSGCGSKDIAARPAWPSLGQVARHQAPQKRTPDADKPADAPAPAVTATD
jgi:hypothetical protein